VRGECAGHIDGKDVDFGTWPVSSDGIGEGSVFVTE
jgi:hypothetical protein